VNAGVLIWFGNDVPHKQWLTLALIFKHFSAHVRRKHNTQKENST